MNVVKKILGTCILIIFLIVLMPTESNANSITIQNKKNGYVNSKSFNVTIKSKDYKYVVLWDCKTQKKIKSWVNPSKNKEGYYKNTWDKDGTKKVTVSSDGAYRIAIYNDKEYIRNLKYDGVSTKEGRLARVTFTVDTTNPRFVVNQLSNNKEIKNEYFMGEYVYISTGNAKITITDDALKEVSYYRCGTAFEKNVIIPKNMAFNIKNKFEFIINGLGKYKIIAKDKSGNTIRRNVIIAEKQKYNFKNVDDKKDYYSNSGRKIYTDEELVARIIEHEFCISDAKNYYNMTSMKAWRAGLSVGYCLVNRSINNHFKINSSKSEGASKLEKQLFYKSQYVNYEEISKSKYNPCEDCKKAAKIITKYNSTIVTNPKGYLMTNKVSDQSSFKEGADYAEEAELWWRITKPTKENDEVICYCNCGNCKN